MENQEDAAIDIDDIGTILKNSRLKSKKSLEEISSELCIRKIYLTALEEGDYETLPPIPYGVGYMRTYAKYLGLSPERAVKLYKTAMMAEEAEKVEEEEIIPEANKTNKWHIIASVAALLVVYGIWSLCTRNPAPKEEDTVEQVEVSIDESVIEENDDENVAETEENVEEKATKEAKEITKQDKNGKEEKLAIKKDNITDRKSVV